MQFIVMIPARYQSSRFQGKPLAKIKGKEMIRHVYERCEQAKIISGVYVATDDNRIADVVKNFGGKVIMTSDKHRSGTDRLAQAASILNLSPQDVIINVQGDQPLIHHKSIELVIEPFLETAAKKDDSSYFMSTLIYKITDLSEFTNPKDVKVVFDNNHNALYFSRASVPYARDKGTVHDSYKHLGVYAYSFDFLKRFNSLQDGSLENIEKLEQLRALEHGYKIKVVISEHDSPEVDIPEDIPRIEKRL